MVLAQDDGRRLTVIFREGQGCCFKGGFDHASFMTHLTDGSYISFRVLAKSYTLGYLLRIGKANR